MMRMNINTTNNSTVISAAPWSREPPRSLRELGAERGNAGTRNRDFLMAFHVNLNMVLTNSS
ncbi:MAG: hypothetical protein E6G98_07255 [Bacillati bacterium ANGP1]|uniref:Uncharacterized protein n=1 Tax=Candidatus Segetimicrobium genomatis TaxID=2569760 RepID=A0A537LRI0_9BACT|nr:MAG: hypothetical protein E6G98_07255 [Terrabacteria group bacterium ANGP1]